MLSYRIAGLPAPSCAAKGEVRPMRVRLLADPRAVVAIPVRLGLDAGLGRAVDAIGATTVTPVVTVPSFEQHPAQGWQRPMRHTTTTSGSNRKQTAFAAQHHRGTDP